MCRLAPGSSLSSQYHELNLSSLHRGHALFVIRLDLRVSSLNRGRTLFSRQLDLCVSSLSREPCVLRETTRFVCVILVEAISLHHSKKNLTTLLRSYVSFLCRGHATVSRVTPSLCRGHATVSRRKLGHPCAGAMRQCPAEDKASGSSRSSYLRTSIRGFHRFAPREHHGRPFWRETWR